MGADPKQASILLVDDRPANLLVLETILQRPGYHLVSATSGAEALEALEHTDFAVALLDVAMPEMDGFATASAIKRHPDHRTLPIIFVTALTEDRAWIYRAYGVGGVDFLEKPLDAHAVRAKVSVFVQLYRQRRQIEEQQQHLRDQERALHEMRFRNLADSIPPIVWVASASGEIEWVSRRWHAWTGRPVERAYGRGWLEAVPAAESPRVLDAWDERIAAGEPFDFELQLVDERGGPRWHCASGLPERDAEGRLTRWLGIWTDIEHQRRLREELATNVRLRDEFIQVAAHELRTPLTALKLRVGTLLRPNVSGEDVQRNARGAAAQVDRLAELVERLLDVSRLETSAMHLQLEAADLAEIARGAVHHMSEQAKQAGCTLNATIPDSIPGVWDPLRLEQVFSNLLSNACKYGARNPIHVEVSAEEATARIVVRDRGIGIPPEAIDRVFGRFQRAVSAHNYGGLGLGLYLVAQIVEAHGGSVRAESRSGEGSTLIVELPRAARASAPPQAVAGSAGPA